jgi:hypothetical protein
VDLAAPVARHLDAQQRGRAESVEAQPAAQLDTRDTQGSIADHAATEQGGGVQVGEPVGDPDGDVGPGDHYLGEASVAVPSGERGRLAQVLTSAPAEATRPVRAEEPVRAGPIADRPAGHSLADGGHPSHRLMARHDRQTPGRQIARGQLEVGPTHRACGQPQQQLARARRRLISLDQPKRTFGHRRRSLEFERSHGVRLARRTTRGQPQTSLRPASEQLSACANEQGEPDQAPIPRRQADVSHTDLHDGVIVWAFPGTGSRSSGVHQGPPREASPPRVRLAPERLPHMGIVLLAVTSA